MSTYLVNTSKHNKSYMHLITAGNEEAVRRAMKYLFPDEFVNRVHQFKQPMHRYIAEYETEGTRREDEIFAINDEAAKEAWHSEPLGRLISIYSKDQRGKIL
jgi:hypothetical protein